MTQPLRCRPGCAASGFAIGFRRGRPNPILLTSTTSKVRPIFADIRIPKDRGRFPNAKSFSDLTDAQLRLLAGQNGFTGLTTTSGAVATWNHDIQFQPSDGAPD